MSNEFKLNFNSEIGNNKESILFIHPLGADNSVFDYVISKLKNKFNCFSVDIRGHGKSPITEPGFSIKEMAKGTYRVSNSRCWHEGTVADWVYA